MAKKLVLASRNPDKIRELEDILADLDVELKSALNYDELEEVIEDADTLEGNALKKARYVHEVTGLPALADDTGLEVRALNDQPGVFSARYAGPEATYQDNLEKLLREMENVPDDRRAARFRTVVAYVSDETEYTVEGICKGRILRKPRGDDGFGYDPVFLPNGYELTFAELPGLEKNKISHRARALRQFHDWYRREVK